MRLSFISSRSLKSRTNCRRTCNSLYFISRPPSHKPLWGIPSNCHAYFPPPYSYKQAYELHPYFWEGSSNNRSPRQGHREWAAALLWDFSSRALEPLWCLIWGFLTEESEGIWGMSTCSQSRLTEFNARVSTGRTPLLRIVPFLTFINTHYSSDYFWISRE